MVGSGTFQPLPIGPALHRGDHIGQPIVALLRVGPYQFLRDIPGRRNQVSVAQYP